MTDHEHLQAQREAQALVVKSSADRAHMWAGLNRYLAVEAEHEHKVAEAERVDAAPAEDRPTTTDDD
ncbi:hypothetical protein [Nocardioides ferulae]|uniref:hypothetical protein n=1 Tax=Nocardioides ferulae TaxID=2340821 RepID=UPI000EAF0860|nr:hypothetical protein [Nocardioides ferulae]